MRRPRAFTLVAETAGDEVGGDAARAGQACGGGILGFVVAETRRETGHIITIDVIQEARRAGVGSDLLDAAEEQLLRGGVQAIALETPVNNGAAIGFYKKKGYFVERTVTGYYSNHLDALVMTKTLTRALRKPRQTPIKCEQKR